jgi:hypothetical protein
LLGLAANRVVNVVVEFHHWSVSHRRVQRVIIMLLDDDRQVTTVHR